MELFEAFNDELEKIATAPTPEQRRLSSLSAKHNKKRSRRAVLGGAAGTAGVVSLLGALATKTPGAAKRMGIFGAGATAAGAGLLASARKQGKKRDKYRAKYRAIAPGARKYRIVFTKPIRPGHDPIEALGGQDAFEALPVLTEPYAGAWGGTNGEGPKVRRGYTRYAKARI